MSTEGRDRFEGVDWPDLFRRLAAYATLLFGGDRVMPGTGKSPVDLAGDVLELALRGKVDHDGKRPLLPLLEKVLLRDFLDLKKSASRRTTVIMEPATDGGREAVGGLDSLPAQTEEPDVLFRQTVFEAVGNDRALHDYAAAILECGLSKPTDIAYLLDTDTDDIENRRKRLRTVLARVRSRLEG